VGSIFEANTCEFRERLHTIKSIEDQATTYTQEEPVDGQG